MDHGDGAGHAAGTVGVVDIVVARRGDKLLIRVERELTLEVRARLADGRGKAARFALLAAVLIFCFAQDAKTEANAASAKALAWIGQRSYEMYLFHLIVLGLIKVFYMPKQTLPTEKLILLPIFLIATFILSWAIEKYYSVPLNLKIRTRLIKYERR